MPSFWRCQSQVLSQENSSILEMSSGSSPGKESNEKADKNRHQSDSSSARDSSNVQQYLTQYDAKLEGIVASGISRDEIKDDCHTLFHNLLDKVTRFDTANSELHGICASDEFLSRIYTISNASVMAKKGCQIKEVIPYLAEGLNSTETNLLKAVKVLKHCIKDANPDESVELVKIETSILQHLLWSANSSLWGYLTRAEAFVPSYEEASKSRNEGKKETVKGFTLSTPRPTDGNLDDDVTKCDLTGNMKNENKNVTFIFRQVYRYSFSRLERLCRALRVSTHLQDMWNGLNYALTKNCKKLLWRRCLDIIILCLVYGVTKAKVPSNPLGFKQILQCYKGLPNADPNVHEHILLTQATREVGQVDSSTNPCPNKKSGNLVNFYNSIFLPNMKPFFASDINPSTPNTPKSYSPMPGSYSSPVRVASNVYVSPLREPLPTSPRSLEYKFPGASQSNSGLHDINAMLKNASPTVKRQSTQDEGPKPKSAKSITFGGERREVVVVPSSLPR